MELSELQRVKQLEDENRRLKHMVTEQALDIQALKAVVENSGRGQREARGGGPASTRPRGEPATGLSAGAAEHGHLALSTHGRSDRRGLGRATARACRGAPALRLPPAAHLGDARGCPRQPQAPLPALSSRRAASPTAAAQTSPGRRPRAAAGAHGAGPTVVDGFHARHAGCGRPFRTLNLVDDFTRECVAIEVDQSLPGVRVVRVLERLRAILSARASRSKTRISKASTGSFATKCLNEHWFQTVAEAQALIETWRRDRANPTRTHTICVATLGGQVRRLTSRVTSPQVRMTCHRRSQAARSDRHREELSSHAFAVYLLRVCQSTGRRRP